MKKIVTIGGGTGQYTLLSGLRDVPGIELTAIVSMVDSGGSTGRLRDELGVLPPGDILKCVSALSAERETYRGLLHKRFVVDDKLRGHSVGNMLLTMLYQYTNDFPSAVAALGEILDISGTVLPVTTSRATLTAELADGTYLFGESAIDVSSGQNRARINKAYLVPHHSSEIKAHPPAIDAIAEADLIVVGPGDLYTSIVPNFLVPGIAETVASAKGQVAYIVNIMTKCGETDDYTAADFVSELEKYSGRQIDLLILNATRPSGELTDIYAAQKSVFVSPDLPDDWSGRRVIKADLLSAAGGIARHSSIRLAAELANIIQKL